MPRSRNSKRIWVTSLLITSNSNCYVARRAAWSCRVKSRLPCVCVCVCVCVCKHVCACMHPVTQLCSTLCDPWTTTHQAPLSTEFFRQEYWTGLSYPPLRDLPDSRIELTSLAASALAAVFFFVVINFFYLILFFWQVYSLPLCHLGSPRLPLYNPKARVWIGQSLKSPARCKGISIQRNLHRLLLLLISETCLVLVHCY